MAAAGPKPQESTSRRQAEQRDASPIRIVIIDDPLVAEMQRVVLEQAGSMAVLAVAADASTGFGLIAQDPPDVLILEPCLRGRTTLALAQQVSAAFPQVGVLLVTVHDPLFDPQALLRLGVRGFLPKTARIHELVGAVRMVARGRTVILGTATPTSEMGNMIPALTPREADVVQLLVLDQSNEQIAKRLGISPKTVAEHITHLIDKLAVHSRTGIALYALRHYLLFSAPGHPQAVPRCLDSPDARTG